MIYKQIIIEHIITYIIEIFDVKVLNAIISRQNGNFNTVIFDAYIRIFDVVAYTILKTNIYLAITQLNACIYAIVFFLSESF